jgi:large subunit ribosomal protein L10
MLQRYYCVFLLPLAAAFTGEHLHRPAFTKSSSSSTLLNMGGGRGMSTSLDGKKATVEAVKGLLDTSEMIFTVPASSLTVAQTQTLRRSLPEGTTAKVVKNKLMVRALEGTDYESANELLKGANMWFFIQEDISATIKAYNAFCKQSGKMETHSILGGSFEGQAYDTKGVQDIGNLPSKQELYAMIAGSIKAVPTKVARVIKAPSTKLARAIKLATDEVNK